MSGVSATASLLVSGGLGVTIGTVATAVIQAMTVRGETKARAADMVADAAGNVTDRVTKLNDRLDAENHQMRTAIILLTDVVDQIIPLVQATPETVAQLKKANNAAKMAV
jgi:hypothetical protein